MHMPLDTMITLEGGGVEYDAQEAAVPIDELIAALQDAKMDGAESVVMLSGNYRGARWARVSTDWGWAED